MDIAVSLSCEHFMKALRSMVSLPYVLLAHFIVDRPESCCRSSAYHKEVANV